MKAVRKLSSSRPPRPNFLGGGSPRNLLTTLTNALEQKNWEDFEASSQKIKPNFWTNHSTEFVTRITTFPIFENLIDMERITTIFQIIHGKCGDDNEEKFVEKASSYISVKDVYTHDLQSFSQILMQDNHPIAPTLSEFLKDRHQTTQMNRSLINMNWNKFAQQFDDASEKYWMKNSKNFIEMLLSDKIFENIAHMDKLNETLERLRSKVTKSDLDLFIDRSVGYMHESKLLKEDFDAFAKTLSDLDNSRGEKLKEFLYQKLADAVDVYISSLHQSIDSLNRDLFEQTLAEIPTYLWERLGVNLIAVLKSKDSISAIKKMGVFDEVYSKVKSKTSDGCIKQFDDGVDSWTLAQHECPAHYETLTIEI